MAAKRVSFVLPANKRRARKVGNAFVNGCGGQIVPPGAVPTSGPLAFYGAHPDTIGVYQACLAAGRKHFYIDNAYFGRGTYYRVTRNARQYTGAGEADPKRFEGFGIPIKRWRRAGDHVLVTTASELWYPYMLGCTRDEWVNETVAQIRAATDREIKVRIKPVPGEPPGIAFIDDLKDAWAVVTESSSTGLEAVIEGVPVFTTGQCAASAMGLSDLSMIENPIYPTDRKRWASVLAANQWSLGEIQDGTAWRDLH